MTLYRLTETYRGERQVYVEAESPGQAIARARAGDTVDEGEPTHFDYRYKGPAWPVEGPENLPSARLED